MPNKRVPKAKIDRVLELVSEGMSVAQACRQKDTCCEKTFYNWLNDDDEEGSKVQRYTHAREARADAIFEEMLEIADDGTNDFVMKEGRNGTEYEALDTDHVQRSRLRIETRKWMLGRMSPSKYGDKLDVAHTGDIVVEIKK